MKSPILSSRTHLQARDLFERLTAGMINCTARALGGMSRCIGIQPTIELRKLFLVEPVHGLDLRRRQTFGAGLQGS